MSKDYIVSKSSKEERDLVRNGLIQFNNEHVPAELRRNYQEINLSIKNEDGEVIGGLNSVHCWNWIEVDILWINPDYRGKDYGSKLLNEIEEIARQKNCTFIKLNTFSFQAPKFYLKHGYEVIAVIENAPTGFQHYYLQKVLEGNEPVHQIESQGV